MASTTKIMTCLYVLEHADITDTVTFSQNACNAPKVRLGAKTGDRFLLSDLLYALMLESYNDVAIALAEHIGGSVSQFCKKMTQEARDYGCYHTSFETPNGLDSPNHYTTCHDLAILSCIALKNKNFCQIIREPSYTIKELGSGRAYSLQNKNAFLSSYPGAIGVKTGYTGKAGYCFVGAVKKGEHFLISVVLGSGWYPNRRFKWEDTKKLMDYGLSTFHKKTVSFSDEIPSSLPVQKGRNTSCKLSAPSPVCLLLSSDEKLYCVTHLPKKLSAPISTNNAIGTVTLYINKKPYRSFPVYPKKNILRRTWQWCFRKICNTYFSFY